MCSASNEPVETIDSFLKQSTNFLFVRDPFSRLFSDYVDKLLAPNPEFWDTWGLFALQKHRSDPSEKSQRCEHDVTFAKFLKFVRRMWCKLQIRGFIRARINFAPKMLKDSVECLDADDFIKVLAKAVDSSTDEDELRNQKMAAMMSAYRTVDLGTLNSIVHLYAADFRAFGFNERPKFIFDRPKEVYALNYSDALDFYNEWVI
ncbi:carbohydrate sulfotransferase [Plakobranchus ocellatus]|uniref:Carbohydrate sulfotransferase n=1 Tax=Plakobranchus ocellatus TaxID=259542 RepID=A0AAV4BH70_9GAST|nr:carbohydrate sulfotransferase [Plakobranchus ocellatus]